MKKLLILLVILLAVGFAYFIYFYKPKVVTEVKVDSDVSGTVVQSTESEEIAEVTMGTIEGRLCYPSDFLPRGRIVAKNIDTEEEFSQDYPGSFAGGGMTYSFDIPAGNYYLRYETKPNPNTEKILNGYHTTTCPTGGERSCAQENKRINVVVSVEGGKTIEKIDLCDFYWGPTDEPRF